MPFDVSHSFGVQLPIGDNVIVLKVKWMCLCKSVIIVSVNPPVNMCFYGMCFVNICSCPMPALGLKLLDKLYMWEASMLPVVKLFQVEAYPISM